MDVVTLGAALNGSKKYTDQVAQSLMGGVHYRGSVSYYTDLPNDAAEGDSYTVKYAGTSGSVADGTEYTWGYDTDSQTYAWISFSKDAYSKAETDVLLGGKQNTIDTDHKLDGSLVSPLTSYTKSQTGGQAISPSDSLNTALGKIEKRVSDNETNILSKANTADVNAATTNLQNQINNLIMPVTEDAEVQNARIGADGTSYQTLKARLDTEYDELSETIDDVTETLYGTKNRSKMLKYSQNGYINPDTGVITPYNTYSIYYFTVPCNGKVWINEQTSFCQVGIYNDTTFNSANFVKVGSTSRSDLPTIDNKMSISKGQTVAVVSASDYQLTCPVSFVAKTQKTQIKIIKVDSTHFNIFVPSIDGLKRVRYEFIKYYKTWEELSYIDGEGQTQTAENVVSSDYWNNIEVYNDITNEHIAQGNSNFITKLAGANAHAGDGHGNEVVEYFTIICDGKNYNINSMNNKDEISCSACRIIWRSDIFKVGNDSGNTVATAYPDLDINGNPIVSFNHRMEMSFEIGNYITINNKLIVKRNNIQFEQCHGAMLECNYGDFTNVICNNFESTRNIIGLNGNVTVPSDSTINFRTNTSQKANYVEMYGDNFYIRQSMKQENSARDSISRIVFEFYNNRLKCYLQPVIASYGKITGETREVFNEGDVISVTGYRIIE